MCDCYYQECFQINPCVQYSPYLLTNLSTSEIVPTGGVPIPVGSTTIPANSIKLLTGYSPNPIYLSGNINLTNGYFSITKTGDFFVDATVNLGPSPTGSATFYLYKINGYNNVIELVAASTGMFSATDITFLNISSYIKIVSGDKIIFGVTQNSGSNVNTNISNTRFSIKML